VNLNPHINYGADIATVDGTQSIGQPNGMAFNGAGTRLYAAAILSRKVVVVDTSVVPGSVLARIDVGEGPTGLALKESAGRLYVLNRHENTISVVNTSTNSEVLPRVGLFDPEPVAIRTGGSFSTTQLTSGRGDVACATCHAFGDLDLLAWDLGDPTDTFPYDPRPAQPASGFPGDCGASPNAAGCGPFHPLKGPQTTQTLRDLGGTGPLHWRGDRENFQAFNKAFPGLLKRTTEDSSRPPTWTPSRLHHDGPSPNPTTSVIRSPREPSQARAFHGDAAGTNIHLQPVHALPREPTAASSRPADQGTRR
jgi:hypothetical protein